MIYLFFKNLICVFVFLNFFFFLDTTCSCIYLRIFCQCISYIYLLKKNFDGFRLFIYSFILFIYSFIFFKELIFIFWTCLVYLFIYFYFLMHILHTHQIYTSILRSRDPLIFDFQNIISLYIPGIIRFLFSLGYPKARICLWKYIFSVTFVCLFF